jgi:GT2 family glycosyltransferase/glycosyltransferase involved in cell wall biosynthesis
MSALGQARTRLPLRRWAEQALPAGSARRDAARIGRQVGHDGLRYARRLQLLWEMARRAHPHEPAYRVWFQDNAARVEDLLAQIDVVVERGLTVDATIVVDATRAPERAAATLRSLQAQTIPGWTTRVVQADEVPRDPGELLDGDDRGWVLFLEAGDLVQPDLLFRVAAAGIDDPEIGLVGWDDDELDEGVPTRPRLHPSWSPEVLLGANYLGRSFAMRRGVARAALERAGRPALVGPGADDAVWWRLLLAADVDEATVARVARVMVHLWHRPDPSEAQSLAAVGDHLARVGRPAELAWQHDTVRVHWPLPEPPKVSVIIPTRHNREQLSVCLPSLARTDYPSFEVVVVDNGGHTIDHEQWYGANSNGLDLRVLWWSQPFNFGAVNNLAAREATGEVLVFLNDDTELRDPGWLREMVGWTQQPDVGLVGAQLIGPDGEIQHGGVVLGLNGFADNLFQGMAPHSESLLGPTDWYRNCLSVTAACVAVRRDVWEHIGGLDERFELCGSDVVLGLDARFLGLRSVVTPFAGVAHLESATRSTYVPECDFFASYWRYQKWLFGGDPYFSPSLSHTSRTPRFRVAGEPTPREMIAGPLRRQFTVFRQVNDSTEAAWLADASRADAELVADVAALHAEHRDRFSPRSVNWFLPEIDSPFYGGVATALRIADHLATHHGVQNQFVVAAAPNEAFFRSALAAVFPAIADSPITFCAATQGADLDLVPYADVSIATLWTTAYAVAHFGRTKRKFYLIQDFEPAFYPAGTAYALSEETYRLGLYGICNTHRLMAIYRKYGGKGGSFLPAVDREPPATAVDWRLGAFSGEGRRPLDHDGPVTVFIYARPGHIRNCWELAERSIDQVKRRFGDDVKIVTAGSWARPDDLGRGIDHLGLLDYRETSDLYRRCDMGVALTVSAHPSYMPIELMASGMPVVAFDNPAGDWILHDGINSRRCHQTVDGLAGVISELVADPAQRVRLGQGALATIAARHASWDEALSGVYELLSDPEAVDRDWHDPDGLVV